MRTIRSCLLVLLAVSLMPASTAHAKAAATDRPSIPHPVLNGIDLDRVTVLELQRAMDRRRVDSVALTAFYLDRIRILNPRLHAVIETNPDALKEARASDAHRRRDGGRGPLEGIPVLLKDNVDTADRMHTTAGSFALQHAKPARDAFLVGRLRAAGAVILGKANMSVWSGFRSMTSASSGWSPRGGQTNSPYVLDRNPCGSSSGSAVAAAASLASVTIGTDTHGSIDCPSGANGNVGIRPTLGLVSRAGIVPITTQQDTAGPITRNMTDAAAVLSVIQGVDPRDPATAAAAPYAHRDYLAALRKNALRGKRIGVWRGGGKNPDADVVLASTITALKRLGATVVDNVELPGIDVAFANELPAAYVEFKHDIGAYLAGTPGSHPTDLAGLISFNNAHANIEMPYFGQADFETAQATSGDLNDPAYQRLRSTATGAARNAIDSAIAANRLDAIVAPTNPPSWLTDLHNGDDLTDFTAAAPAATVAGYPNLTVPAGFDSHGVLPIGMSFFGGRFSEPTLISIGYAFEQATNARRTPTFLPTLAR